VIPTDTNLRNVLKQPFGTLVRQKDVTKQSILSMLDGTNKTITVGDATTDRLLSFDMTPDISVVDGVERRSVRNRSVNYRAEELFCSNPAGMISAEALHVLRIALDASSSTIVRVQGEEDLLALPLFAMAPKGSAVLYGQPLEGIVIVIITEEKQSQAKNMMNKILGDNW
jgi:uncharacterized protein (UPF0218 family)